MENVRPCPYCGGEVEVIKLRKNQDDVKKNFQPYRIQCYHCHATVARGRKYPIESDREGEERIQQYQDYINRVWNPRHPNRITMSCSQMARDTLASLASRLDQHDDIPEPEETDSGKRAYA